MFFFFPITPKFIVLEGDARVLQINNLSDLPIFWFQTNLSILGWDIIAIFNETFFHLNKKVTLLQDDRNFLPVFVRVIV